MSITRRRYRFAARLARGQARVLIRVPQAVALKILTVSSGWTSACSQLYRSLGSGLSGGSLVRSAFPLRSESRLSLSLVLAVDTLLLCRKDPPMGRSRLWTLTPAETPKFRQE